MPMKNPPHPGGLIRTEIIESLGLTVSRAAEILKVLGEPQRAGLHVVSRSPELTILNVVWGPRMCQLPHNHRMWAVIGMYTGREDNIFWRRVASAPAGLAGLLRKRRV